MKRILLMAMVALVTLVMLASTAMAQQTMMQEETTITREETAMEPLPQSGGPSALAVLLPAAALLLGTGVVAYTVLRRR